MRNGQRFFYWLLITIAVTFTATVHGASENLSGSAATVSATEGSEAQAQAQEDALESSPALLDRGSDLFGLVVVGLGGTNEYREVFEAAAAQTLEAVNPSQDSSASIVASDNKADTSAKANLARPVAGLQSLLEPAASREAILAALDEQVKLANEHMDASALNADEMAIVENPRFMLILFGHGNFDGEHYRFNIPGPDITAAEIAAALEPLRTPNQFLLFATSASGAVLAAFDSPDLSAPSQRIIATATKSGAEANVVQFPRYWAEALSGHADTDHDELLTVQEAFAVASDSVKDYFEQRNLLATEHPLLQHPGDGAMVLARLGALRGQENNPLVNRLLAERQSLAEKFAKVRQTRDELAQSDYLTRLEVVLLDIARLQLRIDEATGWVPESAGGEGSGG